MKAEVIPIGKKEMALMAIDKDKHWMKRNKIISQNDYLALEEPQVNRNPQG